MAKAKKSATSSEKKTAKSAAGAGKSPAKGKGSHPRTSGGAGPLVDTNLAAAAAARMLLARKTDSSQAKKSGGMIDQLKADLNKPTGASVSGVLDKTAPAGSKKPHLPFGGKQVAHNQTYGADVTRSGVPRRTPG
jgi:hypothetical protein